MKVSKPTGQGSFGIPPHLKEEHERAMKKKEEEQKKREVPKPEAGIPTPDAPGPVFEDTGFAEDPNPMPKAEADPVPEEAPAEDKAVDPLTALEEVGIELEDEDFQKLLFKGFIEKEVAVVPPIRGSQPLNANFKLLTGNEYDLVDELLGEELKSVNMTNEGFQTRKSMWILSLGITKLMGKPVCQPIMTEDKKVDPKKTARKKRQVLGLLAPSVITKMMAIHGTFTVSANAIVADPEADYLKKS